MAFDPLKTTPVIIGGIYPVTPRKCPVCARSLRHVEGQGVFCPDHPDIRASKVQLRFRTITRWYSIYEDAYYALGLLRREAAGDSFDEADFKIKDKPRSVGKLLDEWLEVKKHQVRPSTLHTLECHAAVIRTAWRDENLKSIGYAETEKFLLNLRTKKGKPAADKYKHNILGTLKQFRAWAWDAYDVPPPRKWPAVRFDMAFRKTVSLDVQEAVLADILAHEQNPRTWFGIKLLATYPSIRPGELIQALEGDFDRKTGLLTLRKETVKTRDRKIIPLVDEDAEFLRSLPPALPHVLFFRHVAPNPQARNVKPGAPMGKQLFYKAWKKACARLGIVGVDLYGGTKHSTAQALRNVHTYEDTAAATMHTSSKAALRYFKTEGAKLKQIYDTRRNLLKK